MSLECDVMQRLPARARAARMFEAQVAILIPAYNEARHLPALLRRCLAIRPAIVLVVDDASTDDTAEAVARAADASAGVIRYLRNEHNLGKQGTVRRGLQWLADADVQAVALIDGDGQHDPRELPPLATLLRADQGAGPSYDLVIGARSQVQMPLQRRLSNGLVNLGFALLGGVDFIDVQSGLRLYRKPLCDVLAAELPAEGGYGLEHESLTVLARHARRRAIAIRAVAAPISCAYGEAQSSMHLRTYFELAAATFRHARRIRRANRPRANRPPRAGADLGARGPSRAGGPIQ